MNTRVDRQLFLLLFLPLWVSVSLVSAAEPVLRFHENGRFKIIQFTDLHLISGGSFDAKTDSSILLMEKLIIEERPDLAVLTGDLVVSGGAQELWKKLVHPFVKHRLPFVVLFGNHDIESDMPKEKVLAFLKTVPYNLTFNADDSIDGVGNCDIPIMGSHGGENWILYMLDSHAYPEDDRFGAYDWVKPNQIQWYRNERDVHIAKAGRVLPSLAFYHIPTLEYAVVCRDSNTVGSTLEDVCSPTLNTGLTAAFMERGDVLGTFVGHDHNNDFIGTYRDRIALAYGRKTGYAAAYKEVLERGARVINIYEDERRFDSYIRTLSGKEGVYSFEQGLAIANHPIANGSFIQEALVARWDDARWQEEFRTLKAIGMKYLVLAPTYLVDKQKHVSTLYPSMLSGVTPRDRDIVDACLRNAEKAGFRVFLGLNFDEHWWQADFTGDWLNRQMELGNRVADELYDRYAEKYPRAFYGWYWVWEVANIDVLHKPESQLALAKALNVNLDHINARYPEMPFMLAPYMNHQLGSAAEYAEIWRQVFLHAHFKAGDIFAPQDCVGAGGLELQQVPEWFAALGDAVKTKPELRFWSDAETFDQRFWTSAPIGRFVEQMEAVKPYVSGIITFAYSHYYSPKDGIDDFHRAYADYIGAGATDGRLILPLVSDAKRTQGKNGVTLTWQPVDEADIAGYYIYRDGKRVADIQRRKSQTLASHFVDKSGDSSYAYTITAYDARGVESERVTF